MNTKPRIELMKKNSYCSYLSADWIYEGVESTGIRLKSPDKHLADMVVPFERSNYIKEGKYRR